MHARVRIGQHLRTGAPRLGPLLSAIVLLAAPTPARATRADTAATHAYLQAALKWAAAAEAGLPAALSAVQRMAIGVGEECPGILKGAPKQPTGPPSAVPSERERGEQDRRERQSSALELEQSRQVLAATIALGEETARGFLEEVRSLHWDDTSVNSRVTRLLASLTPEAPSGPFAYCADLRAWARSGFRTVPAETRALLMPSNVIEFYPYFDLPFLFALPPLRRYEGPADRVLTKRIEADSRKLTREAGASLGPALLQLKRTLGEQPVTAPKLPTKHGSGRLIQRGRTADGTRFEIRVGRPRRGCGLSISINTPHSGSSSCGPSFVGPPSLECSNGELVLEGRTATRTRRVRLIMSNGRTITSRVALVPRKLGGPLGIFYQALHGPSPIPVALIELDGAGVALRRVKLTPLHGCTKNPLHILRPDQTLASGTVPDGGPPFTIVGERYRLYGHVGLSVRVRLPSEGSRLEGLQQPGPFESFPAPPFTPQSSTGCEPHPWEILYGLLRNPRNTVLARTAGGLVALTSVPLPRVLHTPGALAYGAFSPPPTELIVRAPTGNVLTREPMTDSARGQIEYCEGYVEPSS